MNTKFKRALSSVLAFIMLFSCITVMNVSSVWAATDAWQPTKDDTTLPNWVTLSGATVKAASNANIKITYTEDIGLTSVNGAYGIVTGSSSDTMTVKVRGDAKLKMWVYRNDAVGTSFIATRTKYVNGSADVKLNDVTVIKPGRTSGTVAPLTINLTSTDSTKDSSYTFSWNNSAVVINRMELTYDDSLIVTAPCTLTCVSEADSNTSVADFKVYDSTGAEVTATDSKYTLTSGENYTVKATGYVDKTFAAQGTDETIKLTPVYTVTITEANSIPFTVKNGSETVSADESGKYTLTYGVTYTVEAEGYVTQELKATSNTDISITLEKIDLSKIKSFSYWFDDTTATNTTAGKHMTDGGEVYLFSNFAKAKGYSVTDSKNVTHTSYQGNPTKATLGSDGKPTGGNAYSFKPYAAGTVTFYGATSSGKDYNIDKWVGETRYDKTYNNTTADIGVSFEISEADVNNDIIFYVYGNQNTGNSAFCGFEYVKSQPVDVTFTTTGEALNGATLTATTAAGKAVTINTTGTTALNADTEYTLSCSDVTLIPAINGEKTFKPTADTTALTITLTKDVNVTVEGDITGAAKGTNVKSLKFKNTSTNVEYDAVITGDTYKVELPKGDYKTVAETNNGSTTSNRTNVTGAMTGEEVYFVASASFSKTSYDAAKLNTLVSGTDENGMVALTGFSVHAGGHGPSANNGASIAITVPAAASITVEASYSGSIEITGSGETVSAATTANGQVVSATYIAPKAEKATVAIKATSYIKSIVIEPYTSVAYRATLNVPGDYDTVSEALAAINSMTRSAGDTVTINLTKGVQEQIRVKANDVTIKGNGHTISWYYGLPCSYYSVDSEGFYNEELFRDKYEKKAVQTSYWGGVAIIQGSNFYAENVTFKNTYNYEVTDKEKQDGAEFNAAKNENKVGDLRANVADVTTEKQKERAAAVIIMGDKAEFNNCSILSVQDTLGYNGALSNHAYFKNCTIGGNTDFICGAGSMVFDKCTLDIYKHSGKNDVGGNIITAPKTSPYVFIDCEIKSNGAAGTGVFLGRPWEPKSSATFINTKTNKLVADAGWTDWDKSKLAEDAEFKEYNNYGAATSGGVVNTTVTYDDLTDADYNKLVAGIVSTTLGGWTPKNYLPAFVSGIQTVKDAEGNYVIYAEVSANGVEALTDVGFTLSTVSPIFGQHEFTTGGKCYSAITFGDNEIKPTTLDNYLVGILLEADVVKSGDTLHIRAFNEGADRTYCEYASITVE